MRAHVVENGKVTNTIIVDDLNVLPNLIEAQEGEIGWLYIDGVFSPPPRDLEAEWLKILLKRDSLLSESDVRVIPELWAVMSGSEQESWTAYRQYLRDIKNLFEDPKDVVWLSSPFEIANQSNQIGVSNA
jgi:hypothetical protein